MSGQSTNHVLMIEPGSFYANPETMVTNVYQVTEGQVSLPADETFVRALAEFRGFRDELVAAGVVVTCLRGYPECPDMVFPNWFSTHPGERMFLYPMLNKSRSAERAPFLIDILSQSYPNCTDLTIYEQEGRALESTASMVMDHVNKVAYSGLSARTDKALAEAWAEHMGYDLYVFETRSHAGKPVYHTDVVMWIGTGVAAVCFECILPEYRENVRAAITATHEVIELTMAQLQTFSGNALEVVGGGGQRMLAISSSGYGALSDVQKAVLDKYFAQIIYAPLPTLEQYGGGSARCCLAELF